MVNSPASVATVSTFGGFVDDDDVGVFVDDGEGAVGPRFFLFAVALVRVVADVDLVAGFDAHAGVVAGLAVDGDAAVVEEAGHFAVGEAGEGLDDAIDAADLVGGDAGGFGGQGHGEGRGASNVGTGRNVWCILVQWIAGNEWRGFRMRRARFGREANDC